MRGALETPWIPAGNGTSVTKAYEKFAGTLAWLREEAKSRTLRAGAHLDFRNLVREIPSHVDRR